MLKLKDLWLSAIGRFVDEQHISFENLGNLIQIDGENNNTKGSSGSGKTTVFNSLDYLLGINDLPVTVLQSRLTKIPMSVRGSFDYDGKPLTIIRNKRGLTIDLNGEITEGSSKLAEEKLDQILGMPRDLFRKILHKRQKEGGFFLNFTPKEMYGFLTDALNLVEDRKKLEKIELKLSELEKSKDSTFNAINSLQSALKATQDSILALGLAPIKDINQSIILELKEEYDARTKAFKLIEQKQKLEQQELEKSRPNVNVIPYNTNEKMRFEERKTVLTNDLQLYLKAESERINSVKAGIQTLNLEQNKIAYQISDSNTAKTYAAELAGQIKKIRSSICPTCEQNWANDLAKIKENEYLSKLSICRDKIIAGAIAADRQKVLTNELLVISEQLKPVIDPRIDPIAEELENIKVRISEEKTKEYEHVAKQNAINNSILQCFATKQLDLRKTQSVEIDQVRGQMDINRMAFESSVNKFKIYEDASKRYETSFQLMKVKENDTEILLSKTRAALVKINQDIELAGELKIAVKTFISCSFDDALESIGDSATKIIRLIPNMNNATIQFEGQKETKDGKIKEEVNAVINVDGEIGVPIKSLSGGERSAVDLAVDLSVIDFVENETSKGIDLFILDEPFTGLDSISIEMALEVLKNSNSNKRLIVVDHNEIIKQSMPDRIIVIRDGETSIILNQETVNV